MAVFLLARYWNIDKCKIVTDLRQDHLQVIRLISFLINITDHNKSCS